MQKDAAQAYQTQHVMTASPAQMVVMLYDRAVVSLKEAIRAIETNEIETRWRNVKRAVDIICHLWNTLDMERGGEIAENLAQLYAFMVRHLGTVDIRNDPIPAKDVIKLLEPLAASWRELAAQGTKSPQATPAQQPQASSSVPALHATPTSEEQKAVSVLLSA